MVHDSDEYKLLFVDIFYVEMFLLMFIGINIILFCQMENQSLSEFFWPRSHISFIPLNRVRQKPAEAYITSLYKFCLELYIWAKCVKCSTASNLLRLDLSVILIILLF